jgi:beta-glucanase (GH16 family)
MAADYTPQNRFDWPPEIDIFEAPVNGVEDTEFMLHQATVVRGGKQTSTGKRLITFNAPDYDTKWGNYYDEETLRGVWLETGLEWKEKGICFFVDGYKTVCEEYRWVTDSGSPSGPATVMLNLAIGGNWAGRYGIDSARFPTQLEIDYIRIYSKPAN